MSAVFPEPDGPRKAIGMAISILLDLNWSRHLKFTMEAGSKIQELIYERVLYLQKSQMQSKAAFAIAISLKLLLKDGIILLIAIFQPPAIMSLLQTFFTIIRQQIITFVLVGAIFVIGAGGLYLGGWIVNDQVGKIGLLFGPWIDTFAYFLIAVMMVVANGGGNLGLAVIAVILTIIVTLLQLIYNTVNFTKSPKSDNLFLHRQSIFSLASHILLTCLFFYVIIKLGSGKILSSAEQIVFSIIHLTLSGLRFKQVLLQRYYLHEFSQFIHNYAYFTQINLGVLAFVASTTKLTLVDTNLPFILFTMTLLANAALDAYLRQRQALLYLTPVSEVKGQDQAILYLDCLGDLARKIENEEQDMVLISLRKRHQMDCGCSECFCSTKLTLGDFMKEYVKKQLAVLTEHFHNSPSVLISILYFRMVVFKFYPDILTKSNQYRSRFELTILQRFQLYWLKDHVKGFINHRNQEIGAVQSQQMFQLQTIREEILGVIREEVERRQKKWKYLARGLCQVEELENQCDSILKQVNRMVQIFDEYNVKFRKSKQFNLLLLFYFLKVSFLNNGRELKSNLKQIYYGYKTDELRSIKQFRKFIFHTRSCAIETLVDPKAMGTITNVSLNVNQLFGFPAEKVKGSSIHTLMPAFMGEEHLNVLQNWLQTGTWRTIGKLKEVYCIHREQHCFSALLYLKLYVRDGSLHFVTNIFKLNDCDYLILSPKRVIQGLGRKFTRVLGEDAKNLPLDLLIENATFSPNRQNFQPGRVYRKVLMGVRGLSQKVQQLREELSQLEEIQRQELQDRFYCFLKGRCPQKYFVEFVVHEHKIGQVRYHVLQIQESRAIDKEKTSYFLSRTVSCINSMRQHLGQELEVDFQSEDLSDKNRQDEPDDDPIDNLATSSMASTSEKQNYPLSKMFEKFLLLLRNPSKVQESRMKIFTGVITILTIILGLVNIVSYIMYKQLFLEVQGVFFADGAVSDIMQTTQMGYAHSYHLRAQLLSGKTSALAQDLATTRFIQRYVYSLSEFNFAHLGSDTTQFNKKRLYSYIEYSTFWKLKASTAKIDTYQFMENMYYLSREALLKIQNANITANFSTLVSMPYLTMLSQNFDEMKRLNEYFLDQYEKSSDQSLKLLRVILFISVALFGVLMIVLGLFIDRYFRFRFGQAEKGFRFFTLVPNQLLERMKDYYSIVRQKIVEPGKLKEIDKNEEQVFGIDTQELSKTDDHRFTTFSKIRLLNYNKYYKWILILMLVLAFPGINYIYTNQINIFLSPSQRIISYINSLMRGQNRLLEGYFDLKAGYYLNGTQSLNPGFFTAIENHLRDAGLEWNAYSNQVSYILRDYDPEFEANFDRSLVSNVCDLGKPDLPIQMFNKCISELKLNLLDGGIMISMNFFERQVWQALQGLKIQYNAGLAAKNSTGGDYFLQLDFQEVDRMQIFMFKIYQLTQSICYISYQKIIQNLTQAYLTYSIILILFYFLGLLCWARCYIQQKKWLSRLYARLLLIPFSILKNNVRIVNSFKEAIQYSEH